MNIAVVDGGDLAFDTYLYGVKDPDTMNFIEQSINHLYENVTVLNDRFIDMSNNLYEKYNNIGVINKAKALLNKITGVIDPFTIYNVPEENWNNINPIMMRYVMVNPEVFSLNQRQVCNAFDDVYLNVDPNASTAEEHIDYTRVMDGMLQIDENGDGFIESYSDNIEEIPDLHYLDQFAILSTWDTVENMIANGIDPTDKDLGEF